MDTAHFFPLILESKLQPLPGSIQNAMTGSVQNAMTGSVQNATWLGKSRTLFY